MDSLRVGLTMRGFGRERGFTLLEALIALVVLSGGLLAAYRFNSTTIAYSAEANVRATALAFAESKLEEFRSFQDSDDFDALIVDSPDVPGDDDVVSSGAATITRSWVRDAAYANGDNPRKIAVTVSWKDKWDEDQSVVLSTVVWRYNPDRNAKDLFLALNNEGDSIGFGDPSGNEVPRGEGGQGDTVTITEVTIATDSYVSEGGGDRAAFYDIEFFGDIVFTENGLASVGVIDAGTHESAFCDIVEYVYDAETETGTFVTIDGGAGGFLYRCQVIGVPDTTTWSGTLVYTPAGNDAVCTPGDTLDISIDQTTESLALAVVVLTNNGACRQL